MKSVVRMKEETISRVRTRDWSLTELLGGVYIFNIIPINVDHHNLRAAVRQARIETCD